MKYYDVNKTKDFITVVRQMCNSYDNCEKCLSENGCCMNDLFTIDCPNDFIVDINEAINVAQAWYDDNIRTKLTEKEKYFLKSFLNTDNKKIIRESKNELYLKTQYKYTEYISLDKDMFQFIEVGEDITLDEILKLVGD